MFKRKTVEGKLITDNYQYQLLELIGEGSVGKVYKAIRLEDKSLCAIKRFSQSCSEYSEIFRRFENEHQMFKLLQKSKSQNQYVIKLLDGKIDVHRTNESFMVFPYIKGFHLFGKDLPTKEYIKIFYKICQAFRYLHSEKIIHRDISPKNILIEIETLKPVIIDLGLGKSYEIQDPYHTLVGTVRGTPGYIAPELIATDGKSVKNDIWTLGIIFYQMFTNSNPYLSDTVDKSYGLMQHALPDFKFKLHSKPYTKFCRKMANKDKSRRFDNIHQVIDAFKKLPVLSTEICRQIDKDLGRNSDIVKNLEEGSELELATYATSNGQSYYLTVILTAIASLLVFLYFFRQQIFGIN